MVEDQTEDGEVGLQEGEGKNIKVSPGAGGIIAGMMLI
tara:strand:- start:168 stop:281 length:114 start_codon:yes stop_codon:yes gene_type:complete